MPILHMETEQVRAAANQINILAQQLEEQYRLLNQQLQQLQVSWQGPSGDLFTIHLQSEIQNVTTTAAQAFTLSQRVHREVTEWEEADNRITSNFIEAWLNDHRGITLPDNFPSGGNGKGWEEFWKRFEGEGKIVEWDHKNKEKGGPEFGVKYQIWEDALYGNPEEDGIALVGGKVDVGASYGKDGFSAGVSGEYYTYKAQREGILIGDDQFGLTGGVKANVLAAEGFVGIKDNSLGATIGGKLVTVEGEIGTNISGVNVGLQGEFGLKAELGFQIGQKTKIKLPFVTIGFSLGKADTEEF